MPSATSDARATPSAANASRSPLPITCSPSRRSIRARRGPINPAGPTPAEPRTPEIPVLADFLKAAASEFSFVPDRPGELEFKRAYVKAALRGGLTRDQIIGVYAFETGGNGTYDMQSGVSSRPGSRAISPAVGYNQLLSTNTVSLIAEHGAGLLASLRQQAKGLSGEARQKMERKIEAFKRMLAVAACAAAPLERLRHLCQDDAGRLGHSCRRA